MLIDKEKRILTHEDIVDQIGCPVCDSKNAMYLFARHEDHEVYWVCRDCRNTYKTGFTAYSKKC